MRQTHAMVPILGLLAGCAPTQPQKAQAPPQAIATDAAPHQPFFAAPPHWRPIFVGIDHAELATDTPRALVVQALRIDTAAQGLELVTTPGNGDKPLETNGQTTRAFLEQHGLSVAINTHFFSPCCNLLPGEAKDLTGLAIAQGTLVSPHHDASQRDPIIFGPGLIEGKRGLSVLMYPDAPDVIDLDATDWLVGVTHAIAGRNILSNGQIHDSLDRLAADLHPRTLVGYSHRAEYLYLVTIDGRQPGYSTGATMADSAAILLHLGALHALNVDGGGSTTMVIRDPDGASQLANSPSAGHERVVGSNLGFRALPLQSPIPTAP